MYRRHVYIWNNYSFLTHLSNYRAFVVGDFFDIFHKIFFKHKIIIIIIIIII
jgi:hypothetical protein